MWLGLAWSMDLWILDFGCTPPGAWAPRGGLDRTTALSCTVHTSTRGVGSYRTEQSELYSFASFIQYPYAKRPYCIALRSLTLTKPLVPSRMLRQPDHSRDSRVESAAAGVQRLRSFASLRGCSRCPEGTCSCTTHVAIRMIHTASPCDARDEGLYSIYVYYMYSCVVCP